MIIIFFFFFTVGERWRKKGQCEWRYSDAFLDWEVGGEWEWCSSVWLVRKCEKVKESLFVGCWSCVTEKCKIPIQLSPARNPLERVGDFYFIFSFCFMVLSFCGIWSLLICGDRGNGSWVMVCLAQSGKCFSASKLGVLPKVSWMIGWNMIDSISFLGVGIGFVFVACFTYVNVICLFFESSVTPMEKSRLVFQMPSVWLLRKLRKGVNIKFWNFCFMLFWSPKRKEKRPTFDQLK